MSLVLWIYAARVVGGLRGRPRVSPLATQSAAVVYDRAPATFIGYLASKPPRLPFTPQEIHFFIALSLG